MFSIPLDEREILPAQTTPNTLSQTPRITIILILVDSIISILHTINDCM